MRRTSASRTAISPPRMPASNTQADTRPRQIEWGRLTVVSGFQEKGLRNIVAKRDQDFLAAAASAPASEPISSPAPPACGPAAVEYAAPSMPSALDLSDCESEMTACSGVEPKDVSAGDSARAATDPSAAGGVDRRQG